MDLSVRCMWPGTRVVLMACMLAKSVVWHKCRRVSKVVLRRVSKMAWHEGCAYGLRICMVMDWYMGWHEWRACNPIRVPGPKVKLSAFLVAQPAFQLLGLRNHGRIEHPV